MNAYFRKIKHQFVWKGVSGLLLEGGCYIEKKITLSRRWRSLYIGGREANIEQQKKIIVRRRNPRRYPRGGEGWEREDIDSSEEGEKVYLKV